MFLSLLLRSYASNVLKVAALVQTVHKQRTSSPTITKQRFVTIALSYLDCHIDDYSIYSRSAEPHHRRSRHLSMTKIYAQPSPVVKAMTTILFIHAQPCPGVVADIHKTQQPIAVLDFLRISSWATDAAQEHAAPVFYYVCAEGSSCASSLNLP